MPGFDGTGPVGTGSMTGGGRGFCAVPAGTTPGFFGRRFFGRGGGRGCCNWYDASGVPGWNRFGYGYPYTNGFSTKEEAEILKEEVSILKKQLEEIQSRLGTLEKV